VFRWRERGKPGGHFQWLQRCHVLHALQPGMDFTERILSTVQTYKMQRRVAHQFIVEAVQSCCGIWRPPSLVPEHIHLQHTYA